MGPLQEGDGLPGGGSPAPTRTQEMQEDLLALEEIIKQIEVMAEGRGLERRANLEGLPLTVMAPSNQEMEEEFCRLRLVLSQLRDVTAPPSGCT